LVVPKSIPKTLAIKMKSFLGRVRRGRIHRGEISTMLS